MLGGSKSSMPYLKIVCVCPPQTSINLSGGSPIRAESRAISPATRLAISPLRYSSRYFITFPLQANSIELLIRTKTTKQTGRGAFGAPLVLAALPSEKVKRRGLKALRTLRPLSILFTSTGEQRTMPQEFVNQI